MYYENFCMVYILFCLDVLSTFLCDFFKKNDGNCLLTSFIVCDECVFWVFAIIRFLIAHLPKQSLRTKLVHQKDRITSKQRTNVVSNISCKDCPQYYVRKTGRKLGTRIKEHHTAILRHNKMSLVQAHASHSGHNFNFNDSAIITTDPRKKADY